MDLSGIDADMLILNFVSKNDPAQPYRVKIKLFACWRGCKKYLYFRFSLGIEWSGADNYCYICLFVCCVQKHSLSRFHRKGLKLDILYAYPTNDALFNDKKFDYLATLIVTLTRKLFWDCVVVGGLVFHINILITLCCSPVLRSKI